MSHFSNDGFSFNLNDYNKKKYTVNVIAMSEFNNLPIYHFDVYDPDNNLVNYDLSLRSFYVQKKELEEVCNKGFDSNIRRNCFKVDNNLIPQDYISNRTKCYMSIELIKSLYENTNVMWGYFDINAFINYFEDEGPLDNKIQDVMQNYKTLMDLTDNNPEEEVKLDNETTEEETSDVQDICEDNIEKQKLILNSQKDEDNIVISNYSSVVKEVKKKYKEYISEKTLVDIVNLVIDNAQIDVDEIIARKKIESFAGISEALNTVEKTSETIATLVESINTFKEEAAKFINLSFDPILEELHKADDNLTEAYVPLTLEKESTEKDIEDIMENLPIEWKPQSLILTMIDILDGEIMYDPYNKKDVEIPFSSLELGQDELRSICFAIEKTFDAKLSGQGNKINGLFIGFCYASGVDYHKVMKDHYPDNPNAFKKKYINCLKDNDILIAFLYFLYEYADKVIYWPDYNNSKLITERIFPEKKDSDQFKSILTNNLQTFWIKNYYGDSNRNIIKENSNLFDILIRTYGQYDIDHYLLSNPDSRRTPIPVGENPHDKAINAYFA